MDKPKLHSFNQFNLDEAIAVILNLILLIALIEINLMGDKKISYFACKVLVLSSPK